MRGRIVKGIGGFYYVHCGAAGEGAPRDRELYECRAKGIFRKDNRRPLVGDEVEVDFDSGVITNVTKGTSFQGQAFPEFMQRIISSEGLINYINSQS